MKSMMNSWKRWMVTLVLLAVCGQPAHAETRYIVRDILGLKALNLSCLLTGCSVLGSIGDPSGQLFIVTTKDSVDPVKFLVKLLAQAGVTNAEIDQLGKLQGASGSEVPAALYDRTPVDYYSSTVWNGYINQTPNYLVATAQTQKTFGVTGAGTVAIIDTGVDVDHPVLKPVLVAGYDFTRNAKGGNEKGDVSQSTAAVLDGAQPAYVNQSTAAVLDQSTAAVLDGPEYAAFGHGTMVAGVVHLVAPTAKIMPLKAFRADGSGYVSDVLRAIYYADRNGADIIQMSFNFAAPSPELKNAIASASSHGLILVASSGNDGKKISVYPASYSEVMGVGSTNNYDERSAFSNYGSQVVWVAAPGEGVVTTYPYGTYAATWGTSFSAPFVAGTASLLVQVSATANEAKAASSIANANWISEELNNGRLNTYLAVQSFRALLGLR
jgi:hypothetical protein